MGYGCLLEFKRTRKGIKDAQSYTATLLKPNAKSINPTDYFSRSRDKSCSDRAGMVGTECLGLFLE